MLPCDDTAAARAAQCTSWRARARPTKFFTGEGNPGLRFDGTGDGKPAEHDVERASIVCLIDIFLRVSDQDLTKNATRRRKVSGKSQVQSAGLHVNLPQLSDHIAHFLSPTAFPGRLGNDFRMGKSRKTELDLTKKILASSGNLVSSVVLSSEGFGTALHDCGGRSPIWSVPSTLASQRWLLCTLPVTILWSCSSVGARVKALSRSGAWCPELS